MTQVQSMPGQINFLEQPRPVKELLKEFGKKPGLESYANAGDRISLLTTYLWVRQLTPALSFETFLNQFEPLADFNAENCKHPEDAIKHACPRRAADVPEGGHQWTAAEIVDFTILYVDMIREAERTQQPVPLTYNQFLERLGPAYLRGDFNEPEPPPTEKPKRTKAAGGNAAAAVVVRPTAAGQRIIYTMPTENGRQVRGVVETLAKDSDRQYVSFRADNGELYQGVSLLHCQVVDDPPSPGPVTPDGATKGVLQRQTLTIPKSVAPQIRAALALTAPMGNVAISDVLYPYTSSFGETHDAVVEVINGENGPYVDARLIKLPDKIVSELPPRKNIEGEYPFEIDNGIFVLEIKVRE